MFDLFIRPHRKIKGWTKIPFFVLIASLTVFNTIVNLNAREDPVPAREVLVYFIDRDRRVDETDLSATYEKSLKLERYILNPNGRGYQQMLFHEGRITGPWSTARMGNSLQFYRQETDEEGQYIYVPDFAVEIPRGQEKILLVVDRTSGNGPMIHVIGLADLRGNEGLLLCNFSNENIFFKLGTENPVILSAGEIRHLSADRNREGSSIHMMAARDKNGEADVIYNTIRRLRRDNLTLMIVTKTSENNFRFQHLEP